MECACKHVSALLKYDTKSRYMPPQRYIKSQPQEYYRNIIYSKQMQNNIYRARVK